MPDVGDEQPRPGKRLRFVDLFAGLGGFHVALSDLGHECVFACEIDQSLCDLYERNFGLLPVGDIRKINPCDVPAHDVLCAGFPCQPFSKAGSQAGFTDSASGRLIEQVIGILRHQQPQYLLLENVPNLLAHNDGQTWSTIHGWLSDAGYDLGWRVLSPHDFGLPQTRRRVYIVGRRRTDAPHGLLHRQLEVGGPPAVPQQRLLTDLLDKQPADAIILDDDHHRYLNIWQAFLNELPRNETLTGRFPFWAAEFGADYPYEGPSPHARGFQLDGHTGALGQPLSGLTPDKVRESLPGYATTTQAELPAWKQRIIRANREFFNRHQQRLRHWKALLTGLQPSFLKFEWHCGAAARRIDQHLVQFRSSGVRVRPNTTAPSLVAMTPSMVPVVASENRYMTPRECARLQSLPDGLELPQSSAAAYRALGNAVNVDVATAVAGHLLG